MFLRKAEPFELDTIYSMGFDVWNGCLSFQEYLVNCQNSKKYQAGTWYVLVDGERIVSSLIVYSGLFGLQEGCFGIGSLVTAPELRHRGYGSQLVGLMKAELLNAPSCKAIYLHSDIGRKYYEDLGFFSINDSDCLCVSKDQSHFENPIPTYF